MLIALINESTRVTDNAALERIAEACSSQLVHHAGPAYERRASHVRYFADKSRVPAGAFPMVLLDNADQAGALGYHDETPDGKPYGRVFVATVLDHGGSLLAGSLSVSVTCSHESLEAWGDLHCNDWADTNKGYSVAYELGDPVEADAYNIDTPGGPVAVSNFVLPSWFDPQAPAGSKFDYLGKLTAPFTMTRGGYLIVMQDGKVSQKFGRSYPDWKKESKLFAAARTARRLQNRPIDLKEIEVSDKTTDALAPTDTPDAPAEGHKPDVTTPRQQPAPAEAPIEETLSA